MKTINIKNLLQNDKGKKLIINIDIIILKLVFNTYKVHVFFLLILN